MLRELTPLRIKKMSSKACLLDVVKHSTIAGLNHKTKLRLLHPDKLIDPIDVTRICDARRCRGGV